MSEKIIHQTDHTRMETAGDISMSENRIVMIKNICQNTIDSKVLLFILIYISFFFSCNQPKIKIANKNIRASISEVDKIKIYCWCFTNVEEKKTSGGESSMYIPSCETPVRVSASDLLESKYLFDSINTIAKINRFKTLIFEKQKSVEPITFALDSRFIFLFMKWNAPADTIIYKNDSTLCFNSQFVYKYSFNIMDSIKKELNRKVIKCASDGVSD